MNYKLNSEQDWRELARQAKWSVAQLATLRGVSIRTLERYFQEAHQQTPQHWLAEHRWQQALELLRKGVSVKSTALELGWRQASTFSREFKNRFGHSPVDFSKSPIRRTMSYIAMSLSR